MICARLVMARPVKKRLGLIFTAQLFYQAVEEAAREEQDKQYCKVGLGSPNSFIQFLTQKCSYTK